MLAPSCRWVLILVIAGLSGCAGRGGHEPGYYKLGQPYSIKGRWYYPEYDPAYERTGVASWYGKAFDGRPTANGEIFDRRRISAAHPTLPLPSMVRVTNLRNGRSLDLRVNDRGPFVHGRLIDLSQAAARELGFEQDGVTSVRVRFLGLAPGKGTPPTPVRVARREPTEGVRVVVADASSAASVMSDAAPSAVARTPPARPAPTVSVARAPALRRTSCPAGPRFVEIGAFRPGSTLDQALRRLGGEGQLVVDALGGNDRGSARLRVGPVATASQALAILERVRGLGYRQAIVVAAARTSADLSHC